MGKGKEKLDQLFKTHDSGLFVSTSLKVTLIMVTALTIGFSAGFIANDVYRSYLTNRVASLAAAWPTNESNTVTKQRLASVRQAYTSADQVYLVGQESNGNYFQTNTNSSNNQPVSIRQIGQLASSTTEPQVVGPLSEHWQKYVATTAPIIDPTTGQTEALVGINILSSTYMLIVVSATVGPLLVGLMISLIIVTGDRIRLRRHEGLQFRSELVSIASHELRTPLTGLRWSQEGLLKTRLDSSHRKTIKTMYELTLRLQESIEDILQLANLQAGRNPGLSYAPTDLTELLTGIMAVQKLPLEQKGLELKFDDDWPKHLIINCDSQRMKRVFNNLLSNSIKYSKPNTEIILAYEKLAGKHLISLTDYGIGIPEKEQAKVFSGFYRASNAVKNGETGTGMGLYLSRQVIEQHNGRLWLRSKPDRGTTAFIELP